ncbi:phage tail sheath subtilisin-like domain-containing protein [Kiloniella majae]|uniref:phage tail sheath subtilisin-like domain-containing protein n=1 Tax=Kiloniella majae TaxID=1938558 RepID=UPI000A27717B|nr:phage tail sheath subtilisin-like domain-containing protein [Kiloniella majae]
MPDISFNEIPLQIFRPGIFVEIDPSLALNGLPVFKQRTVMYGQLGTNPEATANELYKVITKSEASTLFGVDSMLTAMVERFRDVNPYQELLVVPLAENNAGTAATAKITVSGTATRGYTQPIYVGDKRYQLSISASEAAASIASRLATLITNDPSSYVNAVATDAVVDLTVKWKGETGNDINISTRYYRDDPVSPGVGFTIVGFANGAGNPSLSDGIDALDDLTQYQGFINPYTDTANMDLIRTELDTRWGPLNQRDGRVFSAKKASVSDLGDYAVARNSQHHAVIDVTEKSSSTTWEWAASFGANIMFYGATDPGRPFQTLELKGIKGAPEGSRRLPQENETLLRDGVSTHVVGIDGKVRIERAVTTYSKNGVGADDAAYKSLNTVMLMSFYRRSVINRFETRYPRHKLATSGHPAAGYSSNIVTPETAIAEFLAHYEQMINAGLMDDFDGYKQDILAEKNSRQRGRLDVFDRPRPIDQFHQLAVRSAFSLI